MNTQPDGAAAPWHTTQLLEHLATAPVVVVSGVVAPNGAHGSKLRGRNKWLLSFTLAAWRIEAAAMQTTALHVRRQVTDRSFRLFQASIEPYTVVRMRARVSDTPAGEHPHALLEAYLGLAPADAPLNAYAERLRQGEQVADHTFGTFLLDRRSNWFTGQATWQGRTVALTLAADRAEVAAALHTAHLLWQQQEMWSQRIGTYACRNCCHVKTIVGVMWVKRQ